MRTVEWVPNDRRRHLEEGINESGGNLINLAYLLLPTLSFAEREITVQARRENRVKKSTRPHRQN